MSLRWAHMSEGMFSSVAAHLNVQFIAKTKVDENASELKYLDEPCEFDQNRIINKKVNDIYRFQIFLRAPSF